MTGIQWETQTVGLRVLTGQTPVGPSYDASVDVQADVQGQNRLIRLPDGREIASTITVRYTGSTPVANVGSQVTMPAPWNRTTTTVIAATYHTGSSGWGLPAELEHWELACE